MPQIVKPHTFVDGTDAQAAEVNANFDTLVNWVNTDGVHRDASLAFTAIPSGPTSDPTADNQLARKAYVDAPHIIQFSSGTLIGVGGATELIPGWTIQSTKGVNALPAGFEVISAGVWLVGAYLNFETSSAGDRRNLGLTRNGAVPFVTASQQDGNWTSGFGNGLTVSTLALLSAGDDIKAVYQHNSLGLDFTARMWAWRVHGT